MLLIWDFAYKTKKTQCFKPLSPINLLFSQFMGSLLSLLLEITKFFFLIWKYQSGPVIQVFYSFNPLLDLNHRVLKEADPNPTDYGFRVHPLGFESVWLGRFGPVSELLDSLSPLSFSDQWTFQSFVFTSYPDPTIPSNCICHTMASSNTSHMHQNSLNTQNGWGKCLV